MSGRGTSMANFSRFELTFIFLTVVGVCLLVRECIKYRNARKNQKGLFALLKFIFSVSFILMVCFLVLYPFWKAAL